MRVFFFFFFFFFLNAAVVLGFLFTIEELPVRQAGCPDEVEMSKSEKSPAA